MASSLGFVLISPLFGFITDKVSLSAAFIFLGCVIFLFSIPVFYSLVRNRVITGERP
jgi:hypothetical protein